MYLPTDYELNSIESSEVTSYDPKVLTLLHLLAQLSRYSFNSSSIKNKVRIKPPKEYSNDNDYDITVISNGDSGYVLLNRLNEMKYGKINLLSLKSKKKDNIITKKSLLPDFLSTNNTLYGETYKKAKFTGDRYASLYCGCENNKSQNSNIDKISDNKKEYDDWSYFAKPMKDYNRIRRHFDDIEFERLWP